jgi:hypothetical protein
MHNDIYVPGQNVKLKIAVFGPSQVGKTHFALSAPGPVLVYDAEGSVDALARKFPDARGVKKSPDRVQGAIGALQKAMSGGYGEACGTFVLDSWTLLENDLRAGYEHPDNPLAHHEINSRIEQHLLRALEGSTVPHLVVTAREANEWAVNIKQGTVGFKPDAHKQFEHAFDLVFRISLDKQTGARTATVYKTRYPEIFARNAVIPNLTWAHFEPILRGDVKATTPAASADVPSMKEIVEKYERAGKPQDSLVAWLTHVKLVEPGEKTLTTTGRERAGQMLDELLALSETSVA